jgi:hypothetical protein
MLVLSLWKGVVTFPCDSYKEKVMIIELKLMPVDHKMASNECEGTQKCLQRYLNNL